MPTRKYKDYSLGARLRTQVGTTVASFASPEQLYTPEELRLLLVEVFKFKQYEVSYELLKILFFGKHKYQHVKLDELINYITEKHIGDNAINSYSLKHGYLCKEDKLMTKAEFIATVNIGLEFLKDRNLNKDENQLNKLFEQIDTKGFGTISHDDYLTFLKDYLGSESPMAITSATKSESSVESMDMIASRKRSEKDELTPVKGAGQLFQSKYFSEASRVVEPQEPLQALRQLIASEIKASCLQFDCNKDDHLTAKEMYDYLYNVLQLERKSVDYILENYFDFKENETVGINEIVEVVSEVHFRDVFSMLVKQELKVEMPNQCFMKMEIFVRKLMENCFFFNKKPTLQLLKSVFRELEARSQQKFPDHINLEDFRSFVLTSLCNNRLIFRKNSKKNTHTVLLGVPVSIAEVENSHFEEDSEAGEIRPRQFESSICEAYNEEKLLTCKVESTDVNSSNQNNRLDLRYDLNAEQSELIETTSPITQKVTVELSQQGSLEQLAFSSVPRKKNSVLQRARLGLKDQLWSALARTIGKYSKKEPQAIRHQQVIAAFEEQSILKAISNQCKTKIFKYFSSAQQIPTKIFVNYVLHSRGQEALIKFNKAQIKGKSSISKEQLPQLLLSAYGGIGSINEELCQEYASQLRADLPNGQLSYKGFLSTVGRSLSQPPRS